MTLRWDRPCVPSPFDMNASCRNGRIESSTKALGWLQRGTCCKCTLLITAEFDFNSVSTCVVSGSMLGPKWRGKLRSVWLIKSRLTLIGCGWGSRRMSQAITHGDTNNHFFMTRLLQTSNVSSLICASLSSKAHTLISIHILCNLLIKRAASPVYWAGFACHLLVYIFLAMCMNSLNLQQKKLSGVGMAWKWPRLRSGLWTHDYSNF